MFFVDAEIKPPTYTEVQAVIKGVKFELGDQIVKGYKVIALGEPKLSGGKWTQGFKLEGRIPVPRGTGGSIKVKVKATAQLPNGEMSLEQTKNCKYQIAY